MLTRSGSRVFQASSAAWTFCAAVSRVNGGKGGRRSGIGGSPSRLLRGRIVPRRVGYARERSFSDQVGAEVDDGAARRQALDAAEELFYARGIQAVGMD